MTETKTTLIEKLLVIKKYFEAMAETLAISQDVFIRTIDETIEFIKDKD
ncbi:hypothetical protein LCGC14_2938650 [marine sediment metagenome]|uniref:Uncharacterized protein n=1 Tax=marine sediment metagenome TaxID=412755 RepID=A0A0F8ZRG5_9ZZZZ